MHLTQQPNKPLRVPVNGLTKDEAKVRAARIPYQILCGFCADPLWTLCRLCVVALVAGACTKCGWCCCTVAASCLARALWVSCEGRGARMLFPARRPLPARSASLRSCCTTPRTGCPWRGGRRCGRRTGPPWCTTSPPRSLAASSPMSASECVEKSGETDVFLIRETLVEERTGGGPCPPSICALALPVSCLPASAGSRAVGAQAMPGCALTLLRRAVFSRAAVLRAAERATARLLPTLPLLPLSRPWRSPLPYRPVEERVKDWKEVQAVLGTEDQVGAEAWGWGRLGLAWGPWGPGPRATRAAFVPRQSRMLALNVSLRSACWRAPCRNHSSPSGLLAAAPILCPASWPPRSPPERSWPELTLPSPPALAPAPAPRRSCSTRRARAA